ncbi:MAG: efflux RND transporter permease subunit [Maricaulis sp.]|uniref:efflux RND transporter permease subunit n=1 Tax=Maricaulis sp. TaxID=1486257 RepID=UPI001B15BEE7|nr:efflux RND transporter permease subunit [Maricaulis sp.]MBO6846801.1 efflux RND transporter permease subunit [Maricaulis sp.]MBO6877557.1 efflux RND transporter permease subunit [Maricaulis sp.]
MTGIVDFAINRSRMILAIFVCALLAGLLSFLTLPREADPDIPFPFVIITVPLAGISPEDAERLIVRPTETELRSLDNMEELDSVGALGAGVLFAEFDVPFDADQAVLDVREAVDMARREYPEEAREPVIQEFNSALAPTIAVQVYGEAPERTIYRIARDLEEELETLPEILQVDIQGIRDELLEIVVDPALLETYGVTYGQLFNAVQSNNQLIAAGSLDSGEARFQVKVPGLFENADDALNLPITSSGDAVVTLQDVATVRRTFKDADSFSRYNGQTAFTLQVVRRSGENIMDTSERVRELTAQIAESWPSTVRYDFSLDLSTYVRDSLNSLTSSIMLAILLVLIVVVAALGLRSALLVGLAIPSSFLFSFLLLDVYGLTINMMVMFAMVLAVGLLVDGAIVVVEYADRKLAEGETRIEAYRQAGKRMFWPIISSTATTLAAFLPFLFWDSIPGQFMAFLPLTLIFVLSAALVMALIFLPTLGSVLGRKGGEVDKDSALAHLNAQEGGQPTELPGLTGLYARMISALAKRPGAVALGTVAVVFSVIFAFGAQSNGAFGGPKRTEFFIDAEPEQVYVFVRARGNLSPEEQYELALQAEQRIGGIEGIKGYYTVAGEPPGASPFDGTGGAPADTIARIFVEFYPFGQRPNGRLIESNIRDALVDLPGVIIEVRRFQPGPPVGKDVQVQLRSDDAEALVAATQLVRGYIDQFEGLTDIEDTLPLPGVEWRLDVDREEAGRFGADVAQVGAAVQLVTTGTLVGRYRPDDADEEVDIRVRFPADDRDISRLDDLRVNTVAGAVPISNFVTREARPRVDSISRRDGKRYFVVRANAAEGYAGNLLLADVQDWVNARVADGTIPPQVEVSYLGADEENAEAGAFFAGAMMASLFMMAVILLWQFNNFWHVLLTLQAVVLSVVGVFLGVFLTFPYISVLFLGTGIVTLAGIVVNNNIVLIDTFQRLRGLGMSVDEAIVRTAAQRLRPVMLTTITTIFGLLPMVFQINADFAHARLLVGGPASEWWVQLSSAVVWGLGFSTLLTLVLTPVMLGVPSRLGKWRQEMVSAILGWLGISKAPAE